MVRIRKNWMPNALSLGNLSCGFIVLLLGSSSSYRISEQTLILCSSLVLVAVLLDGFDGLVARLLNTESVLGEQLDTLADMTTFGIAPAFLYYHIYLKDIKYSILGFPMNFGIMIALIYPVCVAYRLARFSLRKDTTSVFVGLPSPVAGGLVTLMCISSHYTVLKTGSLILFILISFLMVSRVRYKKPGGTTSIKLMMFRFCVFISLIFLGAIFFKWHDAVLTILALYTFSGLLSMGLTIVQKFKI